MVGIYPDFPGPRLAYDRDGTALVTLDNTMANPVMLPNSDVIKLNNESSDGIQLGFGHSFALIFPTLRDITHLMVIETGAGYVAPMLSKSSNTTNGADGVWNQVGSGALTTQTGDPNVTLRTQSFQSLGADCLGVKAIRFKGGGFLGAGAAPSMVALLGRPSAISDRLDLWHPTLDQPLYDFPAHFDWGDVPRGSAARTKQFRVKNQSAALIASGIVVGREAKTDAAPTVVSQMQLSYDGGAFGDTANVGALAPGAISQLVTVRYTPSAGAIMGPWQQRYFAEAAVWS